MARKVYACKNKGSADKAFRTSGTIGGVTSGDKNVNTRGSRPSQETKVVFLSANVPAYVSGAPMTQITAQQVVQLNVSTGNYSTTSLYDGSPLGTVDFYNPREEAYTSGSYITLQKWQGVWWVQGSNSANGTGYGTLSSALATTDATASVTLDASSPVSPGESITATNWCDQSGASGTRVVVAKGGSEWVIVNIEPNIGVGKGTLTSALATTDATIGVSLDANSAVGSGTITANNFCGFSADNGAKCYVSTDGTTWELIQVACPA